MKPVHPILVGVGERTNRVKEIGEFIGPVEFMKLAALAAARDAECPALVEKADALHVVNMLSWNHRNAPAALAEALNLEARTLEYTAIGGNTPQWLANRAADNLAAGRSEIAILAGCEVMRSVSLAMAAGKDLGAFKDKVEAPLVGIVRPGTTDIERAHRADRPIRIYPLIENALRAKEGISLAEQRERLGRFGEAFSAEAARHPQAWFPVARAAEEIVATGPKNRMIAFPYTKYLNAIMAVDMAAAVIMTTPEVARRLGIPESKWVYLHGGQDAYDHWHVSERPDIADSPAIRACAEDAFAQSGLSLADLAFFDLYSCFPCMVRLGERALGLADADPRPRTITGGLPYFGGPGNNYVMHSIAEAVRRCRADRSACGMVTSNGYYATKHGVGIYSGREPARGWQRASPEDFQKTLDLGSPVEVDPEPTGAFTVEAYTVWHGREGEPEVGILMGRLTSGKRAWAQTRKDDLALMNAMMREEWVGKTGRIAGREDAVNLVEFD